MLQFLKLAHVRLSLTAMAAFPFCTEACPCGLRIGPLRNPLAISLEAALDIRQGRQRGLEVVQEIVR
jgi:hypothetical protein